MSFRFKCPNCNIKLEAEDDWAGLETTCPECNQNITITPDTAEEKTKIELILVSAEQKPGEVNSKDNTIENSESSDKSDSADFLQRLKRILYSDVPGSTLLRDFMQNFAAKFWASWNNPGSTLLRDFMQNLSFYLGIVAVFLIAIIVILGLNFDIEWKKRDQSAKAAQLIAEENRRITESSVISFTSFLVTNSNQEVVPFTDVSMFKYTNDWNEAIILFEDPSIRQESIVDDFNSIEVQKAIAGDFKRAMFFFEIFKHSRDGEMIGTLECRTKNFQLTNVNPGTYVCYAKAKWNNIEIIWLKKITKQQGVPLKIVLTNDSTCIVMK